MRPLLCGLPPLSRPLPRGPNAISPTAKPPSTCGCRRAAGKAARDRWCPRFRKFGRRVMYAVADLDAWAADRSFETTSDPEYAEHHSADSRCALIGGARQAITMSSSALPFRQRSLQEREQLDLFRALPGDMAPRDSQDLMAYPFFSLGKSKRVKPIDFRAGNVTIRVEGHAGHGIATIWDADVLIWAASQIVEAKDAGLRPSRLMRATPYEILRFIGRGKSLRDYQRLKAALDRLQSTTVATSIRETTGRRLHRRGSTGGDGRCQRHAAGIELILPDWFFAGVLDAALVLTIDRHFRLTGGIERWLYRLVRKHGGKQAARLAVRLSLSAPEVRQHREALRLRLRSARARRAAVCPVTSGHRADARQRHGTADVPARARRHGDTPGKPVNGVVLSGVRGIVLSGVGLSCYQACRSAANPRQHWACASSNFPSSFSNF